MDLYYNQVTFDYKYDALSAGLTAFEQNTIALCSNKNEKNILSNGHCH